MQIRQWALERSDTVPQKRVSFSVVFVHVCWFNLKACLVRARYSYCQVLYFGYNPRLLNRTWAEAAIWLVPAEQNRPQKHRTLPFGHSWILILIRKNNKLQTWPSTVSRGKDFVKHITVVIWSYRLKWGPLKCANK